MLLPILPGRDKGPPGLIRPTRQQHPGGEPCSRGSCLEGSGCGQVKLGRRQKGCKFSQPRGIPNRKTESVWEESKHILEDRKPWGWGYKGERPFPAPTLSGTRDFLSPNCAAHPFMELLLWGDRTLTLLMTWWVGEQRSLFPAKTERREQKVSTARTQAPLREMPSRAPKPGPQILLEVGVAYGKQAQKLKRWNEGNLL